VNAVCPRAVTAYWRFPWVDASVISIALLGAS
jgi:hypothetical protein